MLAALESAARITINQFKAPKEFFPYQYVQMHHYLEAQKSQLARSSASTATADHPLREPALGFELHNMAFTIELAHSTDGQEPRIIDLKAILADRSSGFGHLRPTILQMLARRHHTIG